MRVALTAAALASLSAAHADTLVVGNKVDDSVSFIDLTTGEEVARRETGRAPHEIALSPDGTLAVVVSYVEQEYIGNTLHLFDVRTAEPMGEISLGDHRGPHGLKWIPGTSQVIVTTEVSQDVVVVDVLRRKIVGTVKTDQVGTHMVALSPDQNYAYAASIGSGTFTVIDLNPLSKVQDVAAGEGTEAISVTPDGKEIWVGNNRSRSIMVFDAETFEVLDTIETDDAPIRVEVSPDGTLVAASYPFRSQVVFYDRATRQQVGTTNLIEQELSFPVTLLFSPEGGVVWAAATGSATVAEISTVDFTILRKLPAAKGSDGLGYTAVTTTPAGE
ncbi:MAG: YncE family protein [Pseudomonadota bacterium]